MKVTKLQGIIIIFVIICVVGGVEYENYARPVLQRQHSEHVHKREAVNEPISVQNGSLGFNNSTKTELTTNISKDTINDAKEQSNVSSKINGSVAANGSAMGITSDLENKSISNAKINDTVLKSENGSVADRNSTVLENTTRSEIENTTKAGNITVSSIANKTITNGTSEKPNVDKAVEASTTNTIDVKTKIPDQKNSADNGNINNVTEVNSVSNVTSTQVNNTMSTIQPTDSNITSTEKVPPGEPVLPEKGSAEEERNSSISIFFVLCVLALGILLIHLMLSTHFQYLPESIAIVFLGAVIGLILNLMSDKNIANWRKEEAFSPTAFFLVLLPPIIFESGYNLHKGNFFQNIGSILVFAIIGTTISALVIGTGVYILGLADIAYQLSFVESFAFGSLISAVDPVATVAIFHALDIDPVLNMLVFGESILNDAVAIVLTTSILKSDGPQMSTSEAVLTGINQFCLMFFASAGIGVIFALISALLLKYVDLRKNPSLEFGMMLVFTYAPYALAEGIHLSGIMAILFNGIVMSHYTHFNLSTVTQITMQQTMRTLAFIAETCVFAYLGLAMFSFRHRFEPALVSWSLVLCLFGRACNIYPLAILCNKFREHQITNRMMFIMWFSGLRGAISYALSLHLEFSDETRHVIITTTLIIVLVTTLLFGGSTMPLMKVLQGHNRSSGKKTGHRKRKSKALSLSKTKEWGQAIDSEHLSELTEEEIEVNFNPSHISGFAKLDIRYLIPFFTRRFTQQELKDCKTQMTDLTNQWYQAIRISPLESEEEKSRSPS